MENRKIPELAWLEDPEVFAVNRLDPHSDHLFFSGEGQTGAETERVSLDGAWKFAFFACPEAVMEDFYREDCDISRWADIQVPGHIQMQGYDRCHYVNTMYPWDGRAELRPPQIDRTDNPVGCYVKEFELPEEFLHNRSFITFHGVETAFYLWCNGSFRGLQTEQCKLDRESGFFPVFRYLPQCGAVPDSRHSCT